MSLLGIDVGTTGCKASAFTLDGEVLASAYKEYDAARPQPGWAELDAHHVWESIQSCIAEVAAQTARDPITALAVSSLGEAVTPVSADRQILGPSILNFDVRGEEYLARLAGVLPNDTLYRINGNTLGNHFTLPKLMWIKEHQPGTYNGAHKWLLWGSFVSFMLGADPVVDFSLANRTLLFDIDAGAWSAHLMDQAGLDRGKFPMTAPSGTDIGTVSSAMADALGLPRGVAIVTGAHDQCANALGCGVLDDGRAMLGMGTFLCLCPVYSARRPAAPMMACGLNTEHHAAPERYVSFIYNHGGSMLKWYRDTFAIAERRVAAESGRDIYADLIAEAPAGPSSVMVLPHFAPTGPPEFITRSSGVFAGLKLDTTRGDILKGILEGAVFYIRDSVEALAPTGIAIQDVRAAGGGAKSDVWLQTAADIMGRPFTRPRILEAGALGAAILAGTATGQFASLAEATQAMVHLDVTFEPEHEMQGAYEGRFQQYRALWPTLRGWMNNWGQ